MKPTYENVRAAIRRADLEFLKDHGIIVELSKRTIEDHAAIRQREPDRPLPPFTDPDPRKWIVPPDIDEPSTDD